MADWNDLKNAFERDVKKAEEDFASKEQKLLKEAFENYGVEEYIMIEKNGINIALNRAYKNQRSDDQGADNGEIEKVFYASYKVFHGSVMLFVGQRPYKYNEFYYICL